MSYTEGVIRSSSVDKLLQDFKQLSFGDFSVTVLVDGLNELPDLIALDLTVATETLEGVVDEGEDLITLQRAALVRVVLVEDGIDGLTQLVVSRL